VQKKIHHIPPYVAATRLIWRLFTDFIKYWFSAFWVWPDGYHRFVGKLRKTITIISQQTTFLAVRAHDPYRRIVSKMA